MFITPTLNEPLVAGPHRNADRVSVVVLVGHLAKPKEQHVEGMANAISTAAIISHVRNSP